MANADNYGQQVGGFPYYKPDKPENAPKPLLVGYDNAVAITASVAITFPNMTTIKAVGISQVKATAPGLGASTYTHSISGNTVTIYAWKPTGAGDTTLIAATVATTIDVIAFGV